MDRNHKLLMNVSFSNRRIGKIKTTCKSIAIKKLADQTGVTIDLINSFIEIKVCNVELTVDNVEIKVYNVELTVDFKWVTVR